MSRRGRSDRQTFFDVVAWRSSAEFVCRNFSKGSLIAVDGQLQSRQYQTKDGQNRTAIEVVAENISFTGERRDTSGTYGGAQLPRSGYGGSQDMGGIADNVDGSQLAPMDEDLPF